MSKYHKNLNKEQIELMEKLADIEHKKWSSWQKYLHSKCERVLREDGKYDFCISQEDFERWERQIKTDYKDLYEKEKDSDREQVMKYFELIN